jgi:hypothetical protein
VKISIFFPATHHKLTVSDSLALRVYSNTFPQNMKISDLQKGLILSCNGITVIGIEGFLDWIGLDYDLRQNTIFLNMKLNFLSDQS